MGWVKAQWSFGGWLALFVLGLQLTLSFGHIHSGESAPSAVAPHSQSAPQNAPDNDHHDGDVCAICAVMHLAGASLLPPAPFLALPPISTVIAFAVADRNELPSSERQPFQARAPPQA